MEHDVQDYAIKSIKQSIAWMFLDVIMLALLVQPTNIFLYDRSLIALYLFSLFLWTGDLVTGVSFLSDSIQEEQLEDAVWYWYNHNTGMRLRKYLGMTEIEYNLWVYKRILPK